MIKVILNTRCLCIQSHLGVAGPVSVPSEDHHWDDIIWFQVQSDAWSEKSLSAPSSNPAWVKFQIYMSWNLHWSNMFEKLCLVQVLVQSASLKETWLIQTLWTRPSFGFTPTIRSRLRWVESGKDNDANVYGLKKKLPDKDIQMNLIHYL